MTLSNLDPKLKASALLTYGATRPSPTEGWDG